MTSKRSKRYPPLANGAQRRFFWRVAYRFPGWDRMPVREINKAIRRASWRRPL